MSLTIEENKSYHEQKVICKKEFSTDDNDKVRDHCHYTGKYEGATRNACNPNYKAPKEIPIVLHNGSTYDCRFLIKELAKELKREFKCLGKNIEKYITFSVSVKNNNLKNTKSNLLTALHLCRAHYQILLIIFLIGFIVISAQIINPILTICQSKMIN